MFSIPHSMQSAWRSSYPISSALNGEKHYKRLQNFPAAVSHLLLQVEVFLFLLLDASEWIVSLGICPGQNPSSFGAGSKAHGGNH